MSGNTMRGTPNRGPDRGRIPTFTNSPAPGSGIPRPVHDTHRESHATNSEVGGSSTVSASRQKQSKRDEVSLASSPRTHDFRHGLSHDVR